MKEHIKDIIGEKDYIAVIDKVAKNHINKAFGHYTAADIYQHARLIALEKSKDFDLSKTKSKKPVQALENWLNTVISNRLKNLYRDNVTIHYKRYKREKDDTPKQGRINLLNPLDIFSTRDTEMQIHTDFESLDLMEYVLVFLSEEQKDTLESFLSGENLESYYKKTMKETITQILKQQNDEEE